jgi:hypothetical protein
MLAGGGGGAVAGGGDPGRHPGGSEETVADADGPPARTRPPPGTVPADGTVVAAVFRWLIAPPGAGVFLLAGPAVASPVPGCTASIERGTCAALSVTTATIPVDASAIAAPAAVTTPAEASIRLGRLTGRGKPPGPNWLARRVTHSR